MDGKLGLEGRGRVTESSANTDEPPQKKLSYSKAFEAVFPEYLAMGMTYEQFWDMDASLVKAYRKAHEIKREERNFEMWLQGKYVYDAIGALAPILRTSLSKHPSKADKYVDKPYPLTEKAAEKNREDEQKARMQAALERFKQEAEKNLLKKQMEENLQKQQQQEKEASTEDG